MKKFYKEANVKKEDNKYKIFLDDNELKTPMKNDLFVSSEKLANKLMTEWNEQEDEVLPHSMPFNRYANSIIDRVAPNKKMVLDELIEYAQSDVICYRDGENSKLLKIQDEKWNPILDWFDKNDMHFEVTYDVFPIEQDKKSVNNFEAKLNELSLDKLSLLYFASAISKSTLLSFAFMNNKISAEELFELSLLEELWQAEEWGKEEEAEINREQIRNEITYISEYIDIL